MTAELSRVQTERGAGPQGVAANLVKAWNLQCFLTEGKNNLLCCLLPAEMFEWFLLMTAETGFMMTTLDIPYLELYCVLGHKCVCAVLMVWHLL